MALKQYKPTTPGRRLATVPDFSEVTAAKPTRALLRPLPKTGGRNVHGKITSRHRGGGSRRHYRVIDWRRNKDGIPAKVASIEYDPNRSARIALLNYRDGEKRYIVAPNGVQVGDVLMSGAEVEPRVGNCLPLRSIPLGLDIHNIELQPGRGAQLVRSAGSVARLNAREGDYAHVAMPSGEIRRIRVECRATIGQVGNAEHSSVRIGKAGRNRWRGRRPHVRGSAMNPVSHPMGGGEGRRAGGRHPVSPTGKLAKGGKTRPRNKPSNRLIVRRRQRKR